MTGHRHPISSLIQQSVLFFQKEGFELVFVPEIETSAYNFDLLNIPQDHPARDLQDTFYLEDGRLLRTHTTTVQLRAMQTRKPPVRLITFGRVYRHEATDASHEAQFYQLDGFAIAKKITFAHLLDLLKRYLKESLGENIQYRFRPHYYPFVEPGLDADIKIGRGWREVLGAGMIHPTVLGNMKLDPDVWGGFAFGIGIDRIAMPKFGYDDIRLGYSGDLRFLKQF